MVAFDSWILYFYLDKKSFSETIFSKKLSFLHNHINFLMNLSADQTDMQFQIPSLE